jgi:anti-anti-sigma factor
MSVRTETTHGVTVVTFCGCLLCDSGSLETTLRQLADRGTPILLDLADVDHLNSRTIGLLVAIQQAATKQGGGFWICNLNAKGMKLLQALKLNTVLKAFETRALALRSIPKHLQNPPQSAGPAPRS